MSQLQKASMRGRLTPFLNFFWEDIIHKGGGVLLFIDYAKSYNQYNTLSIAIFCQIPYQYFLKSLIDSVDIDVLKKVLIPTFQAANKSTIDVDFSS